MAYTIIPHDFIDIKIKQESQIIDKISVLLCNHQIHQNESDNYYSHNVLAILIHPRRYEILSLLYHNREMKRTEICKAMDISSGSLEYELKKLKASELIDSQYYMTNEKPRKTYFLTDIGLSILQKLQELLDL